MAQNDLASAFDQIADEQLWKQAGVVSGGYMSASLMNTFLEGQLPFDLPNEAYGLVAAGVSYRFSPVMPKTMAAGGAVYTLDAAAQRFGLKEKVTNLGGN